MRVLCISNEVYDDPYGGAYYTHLTIGKCYDVIESINLDHRITDDEGNLYRYPIKLFRSIEEVRNERIDEILL